MVDRFERFSFFISELSRYWHRISGEEMAKYGLKGPHSVYLTALSRCPEGITAPQLCELCGRDKSDVSRAMALMEEKGLVRKEGPHQNRYGGVFRLTEEGEAVARYVRRRASLAVELAGEDLSDEARAVFYDAMEKIAARLREISKEGLPEK
jgi:DNA-binding MarR family transcriptional regulator